MLSLLFNYVASTHSAINSEQTWTYTEEEQEDWVAEL